MTSTCCFLGYPKSAQPTGSLTTMHGRQTYIASPPANTTPKGIIVIITDAFGLPFVNNKLLADTYASSLNGPFLVYVPDFMDETAAPVWVLDSLSSVLKTRDIGLLGWMRKPVDAFWTLYGLVPFIIRNGFKTSMPKVTSFLSEVRKDAKGKGEGGKDLPIGVAGFCWGGQHTVALCRGWTDMGEEGPNAKGTRLVDAGFTAHPSNLNIPQDMQGVCLPLSIANGDKDFVLDKKGLDESEAVLRRREKEVNGLECEVKLYEGAGHGFSVRADPGNAEVVRQAKEAEEQATKWFAKHFEKVGQGV